MTSASLSHFGGGWISSIASCPVCFFWRGLGRLSQRPSMSLIPNSESVVIHSTAKAAWNRQQQHGRGLACGFWWWLGLWTSTWFPTVPAHFLQRYTCACVYIYEVVANIFRYRLCEFQVISLEKCKSVSLSVRMCSDPWSLKSKQVV